MSITIFNASQLQELKLRAERPENYILKPEEAASALDKDVYTIHIQMVDVEKGAFSLTVCYSITKGQKNGVDTLFRHASFMSHNTKSEPPVSVVLMLLNDLGFKGALKDFHIERHPKDPSIIAVFQEFT